MVALNPKLLKETVGTLTNSQVTQRVLNSKAATSLQNSTTSDLLKGGAIAGAGLGFGKMLVDDEGDDGLSAVGKMAVGAGLGAAGVVGASEGVSRASRYIDKRNAEEVVKQEQRQQNEIPKEEARVKAEGDAHKVSTRYEGTSKVTSGDIEQEKAKVAHELSDAEYKKKKLAKMEKWRGRGAVAGMAGLGAFALASVMDTSARMGDQKEVSRMTAEQEASLLKKQSQERKRNQENGYSHVDMGEIAFEMFNNRLGHHKMGNAKFE